MAELLPILCSSEATAGAGAGLPLPSANIFQRIIRNPRPESPQARERECSEMLAAVLLNAPALRQHLLEWMASKCHLDSGIFDGVEFEIQTEQFIGAKRDDLRILGWRRRDEDAVPLVLWTVEVKVGATFHLSGRQRLDDITDETADPTESGEEQVDDEVVNQIRNYDYWLGRQQAKHRAGFVLALRDLSGTMPALSLSCVWKCLSWTGLGLEVRRAVEDGRLPAEEMFLAKHLLGFIIANLWRSSEMPDAKLNFNDIALIRAFAAMGTECADRVRRLTALLVPVLERSGIGVGKPVLQDLLFKSTARSMVYRYLVKGLEDDPHPSISVGMAYEAGVGDYMGIIVEVGSKQPRYKAICATVVDSLEKLKKRNAAWITPPTDNDHWAILALRFPLTNLLAADDQEEAITAVVRDGLADLKDSGALNAIISASGGKAAAK